VLADLKIKSYRLKKIELLLTISLLITGCEDNQLRHHLLQGQTMGTGYSIQLVSTASVFNSDQLQQDIDKILLEINARMSTWRTDSELSRLNRQPEGVWLSVSAELFELLEQAMQLHRFTEGSFDITVGNLVNLWGFGAGSKSEISKPPTADEIKRLLLNSGMVHLNLNYSTNQLQKQVALYLDLSAIAKGYAVDQIAEYLLSQGFDNFLVEIGGEIRISGTKADNTAWRIAIEVPEGKNRKPFSILQLSNISVATSGDYRNYFETGEKRYSHTINPSTGKPVEHDLASVTVIHKSATTADALATALMVMGEKRGLEFAKKNQLAAFFIRRQAGHFLPSESPTFAMYTQ